MCSLSVFIPAYNAARTLPGVLERIPQDFSGRIGRIHIINDGSTDGTRAVAQQLAETYPPVRLIDLKKNGGYGAAVLHGLKAVLADGAEYAVCLHADGQYAPEKLPELLGKAVADGCDLVQGSRHAAGGALAGGMPYYKYLAGKVLTACENLVFGLRMTDYHSGYLLYSRKALETIPFDSLSASFDFDLEVIASARARGLKIGEIPIPTRYADEVSYLNPVTYGLRVLRVMGKYLLGRYRV